MPAPDPLPPSLQPTEIGEERAAQLLAWQREAERDERRTLVRTCLAMFASTALGLFIMAFGFTARDAETGRIWILGGITVGNVLVLLILVRAWLRGLGD